MAETWKHYFWNVDGALASIAVDLSKESEAPDKSRPWLISVQLQMKEPRVDGLSSAAEAPVLFEIEDVAADFLKNRFEAVSCGRITSRGVRTFYFHVSRIDSLQPTLQAALSAFESYDIRIDARRDAEWEHYLNALFPTDEQLQLIGNADLLDVLLREGDDLQKGREVNHWIFFDSSEGRELFRQRSEQLRYKTESEYLIEGNSPYALRISGIHPVAPQVIDRVVLELFRLAKAANGNYDGWECEVVKSELDLDHPK